MAVSASSTVTILISVFNGSKTIDRALRSVFAQTYSAFDVVVVNDGSTDDTLERLKEWQQRFNPARFHIINHLSNKGLTSSLNEGLNHCTGNYVARLDADDCWHPDKLSLQMSYLADHPDAGVIGSWYINQGPASRIFRLPVTDALIKKNIVRHNPFGHSCVIIQRALLSRVNNYTPSLIYSQDRDLWFKLMATTKYHNLPQILCTRANANNLSSRRRRQQMWSSLKIRYRYLRTINTKLSYVFLLEPLLLILLPARLRYSNSNQNNSHSVAACTNLLFINDRPLLPSRAETIARQSMRQAFAANPKINKVITLNTTPLRALFSTLPPNCHLIYLRTGSFAAAALAVRCLFDYRLLVLEVHNLHPHINFFARWLYRLAALRTDLFITADPISTSFWRNLNVPTDNIIELQSASAPASTTRVDADSVRRRYQLPPQKPIILYTGSLYRDRNIEQIITAAQTLSALPYHFVIVGGAPNDLQHYKKYLHHKYSTAKNVSFLGHLSHDEVTPLLAIADLVLITYATNCPTAATMSPIKLTEAMTHHRSIVVADLPRLRTLVGTYPCMFYHPDDSHDLAQQISLHFSAAKKSIPSTLASSFTWSDRVAIIINHLGI